MMRHLEISLAMQDEIDNTWVAVEQEDWLLIEEKALEWLQADLAAKANSFPLPILSKALANYIDFEDADIDHAVLRAAFRVLGRPALRVRSPSRDSRDTRTFQHDDSIQDPLFTELDVPWLRRGDPQRNSRLQSALAWDRSSSESINATVDANEAALAELEIHIPKPPSSPLASSRPNAARRRFHALREHTLP